MSHARPAPPGRSRSSRRVMVAAAALAAVFAVVAGVLLIWPRGPGPGAGAAGASHQSSGTPAPRRPPGPPSSAPARSPSPGPVRHRDPFGPSAVALAASSPGAILAAVYDVGTGQTWTLGHGRPQDEASIVKVDILETLLARYRTAGSALPAAYVPTARQMIEYSDNDAATALWYAAGGPARNPGVQRRRPAPHRTVALRRLSRIPVARMGPDHDHARRPDRAAPPACDAQPAADR